MRGDCNSVGCLLERKGREMASSGLDLEEKDICLWVSKALVLAEQGEIFSTHS
jgi:hypothetical protein